MAIPGGGGTTEKPQAPIQFSRGADWAAAPVPRINVAAKTN
jgi:hypothetical protein